MAVPLQTTIRDLGYATLGAGDVAADVARSIRRVPFEFPDRVRGLRNEAPDFVQKRFEELTDRGRKVADRIGRNPVVDEVTDRAGGVAGNAKAAATPSTSGRSSSSTQYENRTLDELQELAAAREIEGRSTMKKAELIAALRAAS